MPVTTTSQSRARALVCAFAALAVLPFALAPSNARAASSVAFEAEAGALGAALTNGTSGSVQFISAATDRINNGNPGAGDRVASYVVTFPAAAVYELYARVRVGPAAADDDSLFYGSALGERSATTTADWITVNGLGGVGFTTSSAVVTGGGSAGGSVWKWINLSQFSGRSGFAVSTTNLTQTFQIGAREDGLDMDKFVFGMAGVEYTVADLDADGDGTLPPGGRGWTGLTFASRSTASAEALCS